MWGRSDGGGEEEERRWRSGWRSDKELCFHKLSLAGSVFTDPQTC